MTGNLAINDSGDVLAFDGQAWKPAPMAVNEQGQKMVYDGSGWRDAGELAGTARGEAKGSASGVLPYVDNLVRQAANGVTLGYADEASAGLRSIVGDKSYSDYLAEERAQDKTFKKANPIASTTANIAGGVGGAVAALPAAATAAGPTLGGNMLRMGLAGAGLGAAQGFGEGEGGFSNRVASAIPAAAFGGVLGGAAPAAGAATRAVAESPVGQWIAQKLIAPVAQRVAGAVEGVPMRSLSAAAPDGTPGVTGPLTDFAQTVSDPARTGAIDRITTAIQRSGMTQAQLERRLQQLGPEAMLADLDPQFMRQARMANTMPGETSSFAKAALEGRDRQAGNRLVSAFEGDQPPPSAYQLRGEGQAFDQNLRAVGAKAYGEMDSAGLKQTPELMALYENPYVNQALDHVMSVEKNSRIGRPDASPASPVEIMHKVKQAIWNMGFDQATARPGPNASYFRDLGADFVSKLKAANPALADADRSYAQAASLPEFFDAGRSFLSRGSSEKATASSAPALADLLAKADPQQVLAARSGATNAAREQALEGTRLARALAQRVDQSAPVRDKLVELYGPKQAAGIMKQASAEQTFADTSNEILRGSKTADKAADMLDSAGIRISEGGVSPRIFERVVDLARRMTGPNESVRNQIGRMSLTADPERNAEILRLAFEQLRRRSAGRPLAAALAGSGGSSFASP